MDWPLSTKHIVVKLTRNLRRSILRGHPWIYREAILPPKGLPANSGAVLCRLLDNKGELAWGFYDPSSPLAVRVLDYSKTPPGAEWMKARLELATNRRQALRAAGHSAVRLFNGEGDLLPGMVCDLYGDYAVLQFDGPGPASFWPRQEVADWLMARLTLKGVVWKGRRGGEERFEILQGEIQPTEVMENGARFWVDIERGQKTGFFIDQRDNRFYVRSQVAGQRLLNLFSYTGGFSVAAGLGGATQVTSVDLSKGAIETAEKNWRLNGLAAAAHRGVAADVFEFLKQSQERWDAIVVDPPSMGHAADQKAAAVAKYTDLFAAVIPKLTAGGQLFLSSCSSHITFEDFSVLIEEAFSKARRRGQVVWVGGQGADHPYPLVCPELRYLKFVHLRAD